jgi:hypothetical protein
MWDTAVEIRSQLSRDAPCVGCGHARHTFLPCSDLCRCAPPVGLTPAAELVAVS